MGAGVGAIVSSGHPAGILIGMGVGGYIGAEVGKKFEENEADSNPTPAPPQ